MGIASYWNYTEMGRKIAGDKGKGSLLWDYISQKLSSFCLWTSKMFQILLSYYGATNNHSTVYMSLCVAVCPGQSNLYNTHEIAQTGLKISMYSVA